MSLFQVIFLLKFQKSALYKKKSEKGRLGCVKYDVMACLYQYYQPPQPPIEVGRRLLSHYQIRSSLKKCVILYNLYNMTYLIELPWMFHINVNTFGLDITAVVEEKIENVDVADLGS